MTIFNKIYTSLNQENMKARWGWRSGELLEDSIVPWDVEIINTLPLNFIAKEDKSCIKVVTGGLYKLSFCLFGNQF